MQRHHFPERAQISPLLKFFIIAVGSFICIQAMNFHLGSPLIGALGVRNYLLYLPMMFLMRDLFRTQEELGSFLRCYLLVTLPIALLALQQYFSPAESELNRYAWGNEELGKSFVGNQIRVTGTFSYIAGYAAFLQTCAALVFPLLIIELPPMWRWIVRLELCTILASILLTGSRGPIILFGLFLFGYVLLNRLLISFGLYKKFILPLVIAGTVLILFFSVQLSNISYRFGTHNDLAPRIVGELTSPYEYLSFAGLFGFGAGATYQAAQIVRQKFHLAPGTPIEVYFEGEPQRIMLELGPIGFLLWYLLKLVLIIELWRTYCHLRFPFLRELALTGFLVHLLCIAGQMVFQITFMVYYWFIAGFILMLPQIQTRKEFEWEYGHLDSWSDEEQ